MNESPPETTYVLLSSTMPPCSTSCLKYMPCCISCLIIKWVHCFGLVREESANILHWCCALLLLSTAVVALTVLLKKFMWDEWSALCCLSNNCVSRRCSEMTFRLYLMMVNLRWYRFLISSRSIREWNKGWEPAKWMEYVTTVTFRLYSYLMMASILWHYLRLCSPTMYILNSVYVWHDVRSGSNSLSWPGPLWWPACFPLVSQHTNFNHTSLAWIGILWLYAILLHTS
jgi:hypothetical protein